MRAMNDMPKRVNVVLYRDVANPDADRRERYNWHARPHLPAGTRLVRTAHSDAWTDHNGGVHHTHYVTYSMNGVSGSAAANTTPGLFALLEEAHAVVEPTLAEVIHNECRGVTGYAHKGMLEVLYRDHPALVLAALAEVTNCLATTDEDDVSAVDRAIKDAGL
jgi:hypothetical protein